MAVTNFTPLLGLALPTTGDLSGTWGATVNVAITDLLDDAVAGTVGLTTDANVTLTTTNGADNQARNAIILCTGARTALRTITAPAQSKLYVIINATSGGFGVKIVGAGPTTGITVLAGTQVMVAWNGTDFVVSSGDVVGPASATDNAITRFDLATGKLIQNSLVTVADDGAIVAPQVGSIIPFYYANQAAFPSAATYHGALAHSHADGAMFFAHGGVWVRILDNGGPLGTPASGVATNLTGLPLTTGVTGTLPVANGGTGTTSTTFTNLTTNVTGTLPIANGGTGITSFGTGIATFLGTPSSANLAAALTDETGSGSAVFATSPTLVTPILGTPQSVTLTSATGLPLTTGVTGTLPIANGGTGTTSTTFTNLTTNVTGTLPIANGGTGTTSTTFTNLTTNVTGTLPIANGGTNATTDAAARTSLGATTLGANVFTITNPSAITFPRFNADNTVSALDAANFRTAIGAGSGGGSVSSVSGTGTVNGITLTGTVTTSGNLTLGGTLSNVDLTTQVTGTLPIANGGTGTTSTTFTNLTTNVTGTLPVANGGTGITSLGAGVATFLGTPSSANLASAVTDETGTGSLVFATSPTLVTPLLGTPTSGTLSNCTVDGTNSVGFLNIPQNSQSAAYTLVLADAGKHIFHPVGDNNARTFTIPANSSVAYPIGTALTFINMAVANVTIAITTDTLTLSPAGTPGSRTLATNGSATCIKITSTEWLISGSGLT